MSGLTPRAASALLLVLAGLAVGLLTRPRLLADASTYLAMADSLWVDGDLAYTRDDLARAQALHFDVHPRGLFLARHLWGYSYAKPPLYALAAAPFYAVFGVRGFFVLNGLLLAALVWLGADIVAHRLPWRLAVPAATVVFAASVTPAYLHWIDPFLLCSVLVAAGVASFRRRATGGSAMLLAAAASCRPPYLTLALAPVLLCVLGGRWRDLARFAAGGLIVAALLLGVNRLATGQWSPYGGDRLYFFRELPYQLPGPEPSGVPAAIPAGGRGVPGLAALARTNVEFFVGRFAGILVYFPTLLACAVWARRWNREKLVWLLALLATCEALILAMPHNTMGGRHALGNRLFVLLPVALVFIDQLNWQPWRVLATMGLLAVAIPVVQAPVHLSLNPGQQMLDAPYRFLPLEWSQAGRLKFPYMYPHGLSALGDAQYAWEGNGLWTRGGATAEFVLITRGPAPRVRLWSLEPQIRVRDGGVPVALDWHAGAEVELTLAHPVTRYREKGPAGETTSVYALSISTDTGTYAYTLGHRQDGRYLGVFVRPLPAEDEERAGR